jgi:hypothetical protein
MKTLTMLMYRLMARSALVDAYLQEMQGNRMMASEWEAEARRCSARADLLKFELQRRTT